MNPPRLLGEGRSFYHCVSRVVDRRFVFEDEEKEVFRRILRILEEFTGVTAVTYCLMSNHFHLLLDVPDKNELQPLELNELLEMLPKLHDETVARGVKQEIERAIELDRWRAGEILEPAGPAGAAEPADSESAATGPAVRRILARYERRRGSLSIFMKMLKIRVTKYMNHRLGRVGTLWESRFKSVLVEGDEAALMTVAAYIDLNPVRAGIVERPEDYAYSGYGEGCSKRLGAQAAKQGLGRILREALGRRGQDAAALGERWRDTMRRYRLFLYLKGAEVPADPATGGGGRRGIAPNEVEAALATANAAQDGSKGAAPDQSEVATQVAAEVAAEIAIREENRDGKREENRDGKRDVDGATELGDASAGFAPEDRGLAALAAEIVELLHGRVRYFIDGGAFGRAGFVESVAARAGRRRREDRPETESPPRRAKRLRGADWGPLRVMRDLRKAVLGR